MSKKFTRPKYPARNARKMKNFDRPSSIYPIESSILDLKKRVNNIESASGRSKRTMQLRDEIRRLEALLDYSEVRIRP